MDLEEMRLRWEQANARLDHAASVQNQLLVKAIFEPAKRRIERLAIWPAVDIASGVLCIVGTVAAMSTVGWRDGRLVIPAGLLAIGCVLLIVDGARQLGRVVELDWSAPVAEIQGSLARLRCARIRQFKWVMLLAPLLGFCGLLVFGQCTIAWLSSGKEDLLEKLDARWIMANYLFGVAFVPTGYWSAGFMARRANGRSWWQDILDGISGRSLKLAADELRLWSSLQPANSIGRQAPVR